MSSEHKWEDARDEVRTGISTSTSSSSNPFLLSRCRRKIHVNAYGVLVCPLSGAPRPLRSGNKVYYLAVMLPIAVHVDPNTGNQTQERS